VVSTVYCSRCHREAPGLDRRPPLPAALADRVLASVCADCWSEWEKQEVMVINELRLNFMDPAAASVLNQKLREFLGLDPAPAQP
jgi:Fe-S cluster biosynthesis and repair protein YggX